MSHWFADIDRDAGGDYIWQPCLDTAGGHIPCFQVWFRSEAECEAWIREYVIGAPLHSAEAPDA